MKWFIIVLFVVIGIGAGVWFFTAGRASPVQYQTAQVARGDLTQAVTATGQLNPVVNVQVGKILPRAFYNYRLPSVCSRNQPPAVR